MGSTRKGLRTIGIRDAKARLSRILEDVRAGAEWVITDRGKPIARLAPLTEGSVPLSERLRRLEVNGTLERPAGIAPALSEPLPIEFGLARRMLDEDRRA